jgi:hypothetical protein
VELGLSATDHLVLAFDRNILYADVGTVEPEAEPEGMSGSGVWQFTASPDTDRLIALVIEHSNARRAVTATRIRPLLDGLELYIAGVIS